MSGITLDTSDFDKAAKALETSNFTFLAARSVRPALRASVVLVQKLARSEIASRRRTGKLRAGVKYRIKGRGLNVEASVRSTRPGTNLSIGGVREHPIAPGRLMPLWAGRGAFRRGKGSGIIGFATAVQHPGYGPNPWFRRAIDKSEGAIQGYIQTAADSMVRDLATAMKR